MFQELRITPGCVVLVTLPENAPNDDDSPAAETSGDIIRALTALGAAEVVVYWDIGANGLSAVVLRRSTTME